MLPSYLFARQWRVASVRATAWATLSAALLFTGLARAEWPPLPRVVAQAKENALGVVQARSAIDVARSFEVGARMSSVLNPVLQVVAERGRFTNDLQLAGVLSLPLEVAGQRSSRIKEAQSLTAWKSFEKGLAQAEATGMVCLAYGDSLVASSRIYVLSQALKDAETELEWVRGRKSAQDATIVDEHLAVAEVGRWAQLRAESEIQLISSRQNLAVLLGVPVIDPPPEQASPEAPLLQNAPSADYRSIILSSPLLRSLDSESSFWSASAQRASKDRYAPLALVITGGRGDLGEARLGAGVSVSFPITRRNEGEIARAHAEQGRVGATRASVLTIMDARLRGAYASYQSAVQALQLADQAALPAARSVVDSSLAAYRAGKIDYVHILIARRDYAAAQSRRLDLVAAAWRAYAEIAALRGELP